MRTFNPLFKRTAELSSRLLMRRNFKEMLRFMGRTKLSKSSVRRLRELPWYLVVGASHSGKTTLLSQSGLPYILQKQSKTEVSTQAKTQQLEWWATREAVMVDVPGQFWRAQTSKQQHTWQEFLKLIRRHRCPLAGIIVTLPAQQLAKTWTQTSNQQYRVLAKRLGQLAAGIKQPTRCYLVVTQMDAVEGFNEYFSTLDLQQRQQPWGFSCPQHSKEPLEQVIAHSFQQFVSRLHQTLVSQLHRQRDSLKRDGMQRFPVHLEQCQTALLAWAKQCYASFSSNPHLQFSGVYFTSSEQSKEQSFLGSNEITRSFELQHYQPQQQVPWQSRPYFITELFKQVIFDHPLPVGLKSRWHRALSARVVMLMMALLVLAGTSFYLYQFQARFRSISTMQHVLSDYENLQQQLDNNSSAIRLSDLTRTIEVLSRMHLALKQFSHQTHRWFSPMQPEQSRYDLKTKQAYQQAIGHTLIPQLVQLAQARLTQVQALHHKGETLSPQQLVQSYEDVRIYLMLLQANTVQVSAITQWLLTLGPNETQRDTLAKLPDLLNVKRNQQWPRLPQSIALSEFQSWFKPYQASELIYLQMKQGLPRQEPLDLLGVSKSYFTEKAQAARVSAMFQPDQRTNVLTQIKKAVANTYNHPVFMHQLRLALPASIERLEQQVVAHYWQDYLSHWQNYVSQLQLKPFRNLQQAALVLEHFSDERYSPLLWLGEHMTEALSPASATVDSQDLSFNWTATFSSLKKVQQKMTHMAHQSNSAQSAYEYAKQRFSDAVTQEALTHLRETAEASPEPIKHVLLELLDKSWQVVLVNASRYLNAVWITQVYPFYAERLSAHYPFSKGASQDIAMEDFTRFLGPEGILSHFYQDFLQPFIDKTHTPWQMRHLDGRQLEVSDVEMSQLNYAYLLQHMFFKTQDKRPSVNFSLRLLSMSPLLSRFAMQMGEQYIVFQSNGDPSVKQMQWPDVRSEEPTILAYVTVDGQENDWKLSGAWSFFKFLDQAQVLATNDPRCFILRFDEEGKQVQLQLTASEDLNPFIPDAIHRMSLPARLT